MSYLLATDAEIAVWQDRAVNGPYKVRGDSFTNSPNAYDACKARADDNTTTELYSYVPGWSGIHRVSHGTLACAFVYLCGGGAGYGTTAKSRLIAQCQNSQVNWTTMDYQGDSGTTNAFHAANWVVRLINTFDYIKALLSAGEKSVIEAWFDDAAEFFRWNTQENLKKQFPNRLNRDYSVKLDAAANGGTEDNSLNSSYAYISSTGTRGYGPHPWLGKEYNNRVASQLVPVVMWGVYRSDDTLIDQSKLWMEEWLKFGVYPDGTQVEYERNGDYSNPQTGSLYYGTINIEVAITICDCLGRIGDVTMFNYTTSDGLHGTAGGPKSLAKVLNTLAEHTTSEVLRYYNSVTANNLQDTYSDATGYGYYYDLLLAWANLYYKSTYYTNVYRRQQAGCIDYAIGGYWGAATSWWPWGGPTAAHPALQFQYAEMETNPANPYYNGTPPIPPPDLPPPTTVVTGRKLPTQVLGTIFNY